MSKKVKKKMLNNKKILITGGAGFIGRNILESLGNKYEFLAPSQQELDLIDEKKVSSFFRENKIDVVIHSAIKPSHRNASDPTSIFYTDSRMFFNIARNSQYYKKMIVLSSGAIYDINQSLSKVKEEYFDSFVPVDEHGFYRYIAGKYIELVDNILELRIFSIFGKYEDYAIRFVSNAICKTIFDLPITIKQNRKLDYLYVKDLIPILEYFIENEVKYKAYNITPNHPIDLYSLAEKIKDISGKNLLIKVDKPGMGLEYSGDNSRLRNEISDIKFTPTDEAIRELYNWYLENKHLINPKFLLTDK